MKTPLKDILGKPGEGVHFHVFGVAIVDVLATVAVGCAIGYFTGLLVWAPLFILLLFLVGQMLHLAIGVETTVAKFLKGGNP